MANTLTFTTGEVPAVSVTREPHPMRAPIAAAVATLKVGGKSIVTTVAADDADRVRRMAREEGAALGFTVRSIVEDAKNGKATVTLWAVPKQSRPGSGRKPAAK